MNQNLHKKFALAALFFLTVAAGRAEPTTITAEKVKAALPELQRLIEQTMQKTGVPGLAISVVYKDQVIYLKGFGVREAGKTDPVDPDTVFQLASVSKPIASTVIAALVGEKMVRWDDPIIQLDPGFQMYDPWVTREVTIRDMLAHRSGLPDHAGDLLEDIGFDRDAVLFRLRYQHPSSSFRSHYDYTNFGFTEAAIAAAKATGKPWEEIAAVKLYAPLGMHHTSSRYADFAKSENHALGHVLVDGKWVARYKREPDAQSPAGGVSSSVRDMAQWVRLQLANGKLDDKQIIDAEALAETHRPQIVSFKPENPAENQADFYGLGWGVSYQGRIQWSHSGAFAYGAATCVYLFPGEELGVVVLTNTSPMGVPEAISKSFLDLALTGKMEKDWVDLYRGRFAQMVESQSGATTDYTKPLKETSPALPPDAYAGVYRSDLFGDIEIVQQEGQLVLRIGPKQEAFPMRHFDRDLFTYQPTGENASGLSAVTFALNGDAKAVAATIENLNFTGQGTFSRAKSAP